MYLDRVVAPAGFRRQWGPFDQQHRWAKGTVQTARKLLPALASAPVDWRVRLEALVHLTMVAAYPMVFGLAVLLPVSIGARSTDAAHLPLDGRRDRRSHHAQHCGVLRNSHAPNRRAAAPSVKSRRHGSWGGVLGRSNARRDRRIGERRYHLCSHTEAGRSGVPALVRERHDRLILTGLMAGYYAVAAVGVAAMPTG